MTEPRDDELFRLQQTLYTSSNPTRRWLHLTRRDWIIDAIREWGAGADRALEVGPGSGVYLPALCEVAGEVRASDIEDAYLSRLSPLTTQFPNLRLERDDITDSDFPDENFDMILCSEVIEHIRDSQSALAEMRRVLRRDGVLILSTPQRYSPLEVFAKLAFLPGIIQIVRRIYNEPILDTEHINLMTRQTLRRQLADAGFVVKHDHTSGVYLPGIAELLGSTGLRFEQALEPRLRGTRFEWLLWTQYVVATRN